MNTKWIDRVDRKIDTEYLHRDVLLNILMILYPSMKAIKGIEIGVMNGDTSFHLLRHMQELTLYGIDPTPQKQYMIDSDRMRCIDRLKLLETTSDKAASSFEKDEIDFVWIDGDHSYEQVKRDIENYLPIAKDFIGGHDYGSQGYAGVKRAVDEVFGDKVIVLSDYSWVVEL